MLEFLKANWYYFLIGAVVLAVAIILIVGLSKKGKKNSTNIDENKKVAEEKSVSRKIEIQKNEIASEDKKDKAEPKDKKNEKTTQKKSAKANVEKVEVAKDAQKQENDDETVTGEQTYRVVYDKNQKNWVVKIDGGKRASKRCATKAEALEVAKTLAKKKDADLSIHKKNGKFQKQ